MSTGCGCSGAAGCGSSMVQLQSPEIKPAEVGRLSTELGWRDVLGGWRVRWGIGRMHYKVAPGLYRVGEPDENSPVLVTANYKLTVDAVRRELARLNAWVLILDTRGVNVWCAAGKGTFGTAELVEKIRSCGLAAVVKHRHLVLPQLGATGVAAHEVKRATGFTVHYGPVRATDIREYLAAGMKASAEMRRVKFGFRDRLVLTPNELIGAPRTFLLGLAALVVLEVARHRQLNGHVMASLTPYLAAYLTGGVLVPLLLPILPFRAFAAKGAVAALGLLAILYVVSPMQVVEGSGTALLVVAIVSYMAMMFTGATTFTTLSGVRQEVRYALPAILTAAAIGAVLRVTAVFV